MAAQEGQVISGLEGVLAFESKVAYIDGLAPELVIRGYQIQDIASRLTYEDMVFLLWNDLLPDKDQSAAFQRELAGLRVLPAPVVEAATKRAHLGAPHGHPAHGRVHAGGTGPKR